MADAKSVYRMALRVLLWSTLIAGFWTAMTAYWNRNEPATGLGLLLVFVVVWVVSLPITVGTELGLLLFRTLVSSRARPGRGAAEPGAGPDGR